MHSSSTTSAARSADRVVRGTFRAALHFEDLTAHRTVKVTSMLRITGKAHFTLWQTEIGGPHFKERTGQFTPILFMGVEVSDSPIETREPLAVEVTIRLGRETGTDGRTRRLVSEEMTTVFAHSPRGERIRVGQMHKQSIFTRLCSDPERRRVTQLHPSLGLGVAPEREIRAVRPAELLEPPAGFAAWGTRLDDATAHVWSCQQSDPNHHVHAMEYIRVLDTLAADLLAGGGVDLANCHLERARVLFRSPCFPGEWYRRSARAWQARGDGTLLVSATIHKAADRWAPPSERPAVICQLWMRPLRTAKPAP